MLLAIQKLDNYQQQYKKPKANTLMNLAAYSRGVQFTAQALGSANLV